MAFDMGGFGSGNWSRWDRKTTTDDVPRLDIRALNKDGLLCTVGSVGSITWSYHGEISGSVGFRVLKNSLVLIYRNRNAHGKWQNMYEPIKLDRTPCNFGGNRYWFLCPGCNKRIAVLYGSGPRFLCQPCSGVVYASKNESYIDRMMRKARKIRLRLGGTDDLSLPIPDKPKFMHRDTYQRMVQKNLIASQTYTEAIARKLRMTDIDQLR